MADRKPNDAPEASADAPSAGSRSIDLETLSELMRLMGENDLVELEYETGDLAVRLSKQGGAVPAAPLPQTGVQPMVHTSAPGPEAESVPAEQDEYEKIVSPMVGTFYLSPSPDTAPFVAAGTDVSDDTVVCLIEAMKVFNEIKAGTSGRIVKVLVDNEASVEFGQPLFLVEPV